MAKAATAVAARPPASENSTPKSTPKPSGLIPWKPGQSGNPAGRKPGIPNKATSTIKAFAQSLFNRPTFRKNLLRQWDELTLDPMFRRELIHYAFGKPTTPIDLNINFDHAGYLARLSEPVVDGELADD